ncbi:hypothetical protein TCON_1668 [Astathelohania contejeani]|uniref:Uncharacterized protein n=1 Tax=Astathelohania contejeani TaxID=164912 RepID=A0ABQ7HY67_9MICR|nr:hypothetical protein TCON_1668 [Thelohania contejeani]
MVLDYGIYFSKQFGMAILHKKIIISDKIYLKMISNKPIEYTSKIVNIIKDPRMILRDDGGPTKEKLKLYIAACNKEYRPNISSGSSFSQYIHTLLNLDPQAWRQLYYTNTELFYRLAEAWNLDAKDIRRMCLYTKNYLEVMDIAKEEINKIVVNYEKMLKQIFDNEENLEYCDINNVFYPEVVLFNQYGMKKKDLAFSGFYNSVNERGIMYYIKSRLDNRRVG